MEREFIYHKAKNIQFPFYEAKSGLSILPTMNTMTKTSASHEVLGVLDSIRRERDHKRKARDATVPAKHGKSKGDRTQKVSQSSNESDQNPHVFSSTKDSMESCNSVKHQQNTDFKYSLWFGGIELLVEP